MWDSSLAKRRKGKREKRKGEKTSSLPSSPLSPPSCPHHTCPLDHPSSFHCGITTMRTGTTMRTFKGTTRRTSRTCWPSPCRCMWGEQQSTLNGRSCTVARRGLCDGDEDQRNITWDVRGIGDAQGERKARRGLCDNDEDQPDRTWGARGLGDAQGEMNRPLSLYLPWLSLFSLPLVECHHEQFVPTVGPTARLSVLALLWASKSASVLP